MLKKLKYRLYPSKEQVLLLNKHFNHCRFIYNLALETKQMVYLGNKIILSAFDINKQLPELKKECPWLKEVNSQSLQASIKNMDNAFTNFSKGRAKFPKFKKKSSKSSFTVPQNVEVKNNILIIPKFKKGIRLRVHRPINGTIKGATISVTSTGKYFASILVDTNTEIPSKIPITENTTIGIDLGIKDFAITSDGEVFENPKYLRKAQAKLKYTQRKYSKHKGNRTKKRLALLHEKVANKRKDFLHKVSTQLIRENQTIALETLAVNNMVKNHKLAQAISDASWSTFVSMLEYKADWYGTNVLRIGTFAPSSKTCSNCGHINKELTLKDRSWTCPKCDFVLNRDVNAAINIKNFALNKLVSGTDTKIQGELPTLVGVITSDAICFSN